MPRISVIVPVYKAESYLHRCVDSILNQTFTDFKLILVDDGSPDSCPSICDEYAAREKRVLVIHKENGGPGDARNAGLEWAMENSSQWISFIDSDDWVAPRYLEVLLAAAINLDTRVSICEAFSDESVAADLAERTKVPYSRPFGEYYTCGRNIVAPWGKLYSKELFQNIRFPVSKFAEDAFTTHKVLFAAKRIAVVESALYYYFVRAESTSHSNFGLKNLDEIEAWREQVSFFKAQNEQRCEELAARRHIHVSAEVINGLQRDPENKKIVHSVRKELKNSLRKSARKLQMSPASHPWIFEAAYPTEMKCYWYYQAFINKVKRIFSKD